VCGRHPVPDPARAQARLAADAVSPVGRGRNWRRPCYRAQESAKPRRALFDLRMPGLGRSAFAAPDTLPAPATDSFSLGSGRSASGCGSRV
jgi:hypothetical protein